MKTGEYDDIINMPHHVSLKHPKMPVLDRAAQFSPFAALTGHEDAIKETSRLTDCKIDLDENEKTIINHRLQMILENINSFPEVTVTYFNPDNLKIGGSYVCYTGKVLSIDSNIRKIIFKDGTSVLIDDIFDLTTDLYY